MYRGHLSNPGEWPLTCGYREIRDSDKATAARADALLARMREDRKEVS